MSDYKRCLVDVTEASFCVKEPGFREQLPKIVVFIVEVYLKDMGSRVLKNIALFNWK